MNDLYLSREEIIKIFIKYGTLGLLGPETKID